MLSPWVANPSSSRFHPCSRHPSLILPPLRRLCGFRRSPIRPPPPMSSSSCAAQNTAGLVAMDCLVVCCCCPCLVLQITVFLFVRLPKKVVVKYKRIILRRWHRRRAAKRGCSNAVSGMKLEELLDGEFGINGGEYYCRDVDDGAGGDGRWKERGFWIDGDGDGWRGRCFAVDDDDDVWEALVEQEGLFWFGSFWGRTEQGDPVSAEDQMYAGLSLPVVLERV